MRFDSSTWLLFLAAGAVAAAASVACSSAPPSDVEGASAAATRAAFDRNDVLDDASLKDTDAMTETDVQKFLDKTPWGTKSALATYEEDGKTAAQIIVAASQKHGINPLELLVRAQMEQGLISHATAKTSAIDIAFGCGCPHSSVCSDKYMGFANQAECAAGTLSRSIAAAASSTGTVSGWARSRAKETQDGMTVTPKNAATAALYTYTPWVGEAGGGRAGVGGASLHFAVWDRFATATQYGAWANGDTTPTTPSTPTSGTADAGPNPTEPNEPDPGTQPEPEPEPDPGEPDPTPTPTTDSGTNGTTTGDAGTKSDSGTTNSAPMTDGKDDSALLEEGSAPPASNAPPPKPTSGRRAPEELPEASEEELSKKPKSSSDGGGCSMSTSGGATGDGALFGLGLVVALVRARKRSKADVSR